MSLRESILGLLMREPMSGYEIKTFYRDTIKNFWEVSDGQLYPTLKKMHKQGLITKRVITQQNYPNKHLYTITDDGKKTFYEWIKTPVRKTQELKEPFALKFFFFDYLTKDEILKHLDTQIEVTLRALEENRSLRKSYSSKVTHYQCLVADAIPFFYELRLLWLYRVRTLVENNKVNRKNPLYTDSMLNMVKAFYSEIFSKTPSKEFTNWMKKVMNQNKKRGPK